MCRCAYITNRKGKLYKTACVHVFQRELVMNPVSHESSIFLNTKCRYQHKTFFLTDLWNVVLSLVIFSHNPFL